jgi:phenazine biosynthesis protein phzE
MMAVVGDRGGRVTGPYLKEMAHLAHTEYVLAGRTSLDVRDVLAATGTEVGGSTPDEFARHIKSELGKWAAVVKKSGARVD